MDIQVSAKNCEVGTAVKDRAVERVARASRLYGRLVGVEVVFREEAAGRNPQPARVEVTATAKGTHIRAQGSGVDHRQAVDEAAAKFERQLRAYKNRLVDRQRRSSRPADALDVDASVLVDATPGQPAEPVAAPAEPIIARRKRFDIAELTPEDAAWQLELLGHDFFLFMNADTGRCNVVYRRHDGDLGLIEPV